MKTNSLKKSESNLTKFSKLNLIELKNVKGGEESTTIVSDESTPSELNTFNRGSFAVSGKSQT